ncbi:hypothetical protein OGAPHI_000370 [Ogataea philodendri]|uniref:Uncharacterized protein n=1 Tax=Ogataea philodendri TaxID=1378263 RepID=A0A9P8PHL5_9ASCO|nr:uncharacterized protein OGAPHI_000370 [Ogataea philodendri]KAH3671665.1 hypothetical protein OGAPHI_000370 [Ogataea philodendri]
MYGSVGTNSGLGSSSSYRGCEPNVIGGSSPSLPASVSKWKSVSISVSSPNWIMLYRSSSSSCSIPNSFTIGSSDLSLLIISTIDLLKESEWTIEVGPDLGDLKDLIDRDRSSVTILSISSAPKLLGKIDSPARSLVKLSSLFICEKLPLLSGANVGFSGLWKLKFTGDGVSRR